MKKNGGGGVSSKKRREMRGCAMKRKYCSQWNVHSAAMPMRWRLQFTGLQWIAYNTWHTKIGRAYTGATRMEQGVW